MRDLIRCRGKVGRLAALMVGATTMLALVLAGTPASADPSDANSFNPTNTFVDATGDTELLVMSDRDDGTNQTYHVNTIATVDATSVDWYYCPDTYAGGDPTAGGSGCTLAGADGTPETPSGVAGADEAYELDFNVPDDGSHDWITWACAGTPKNQANCVQLKVEDAQFDDASTGTPASQNAAGDLLAPQNPSNVSNTSFTAGGTTSPDVTEVTFCVSDVWDANISSVGADDCVTDGTPDNPPGQQSMFKAWSGALDPTDNSESAVAMYETAGGATSGLTINCSGNALDCLLDQHYVTSSNQIPTSIKMSFPAFGEPSTLPNNCDEPEATQSATDNSTATVDVNGCIFDQSGSQMAQNVEFAWQLTQEDPNASSTNELGFIDHGGCDSEGDENDTNLNSFFEQLDGDVGDAGCGFFANNRAETHIHIDTAGTYNVVFCLDSDDNADDFSLLPLQSATPCSGEALSTTGTLTVTQAVDHVHVKKQGTEGPQCHTGSSTATAPAGSNVNLVGCALGVLPGGGEQAAGGVHVLWFINPANNPEDPGQIATQENSTDAGGKADATITSGNGAAEKTTTARFCVDEFPATGGEGLGNGICDAGEPGGTAGLQADFQINWTAAATPAGDCPGGVKKKTGTSGDDKLSGGPDCDKLLGKKGEDKLKGKGGTDVLVGGPGDDILIGGPGDDKCRGGAGQDKLKNC